MPNASAVMLSPSFSDVDAYTPGKAELHLDWVRHEPPSMLYF
jgi:hypothetical protein